MFMMTPTLHAAGGLWTPADFPSFVEAWWDPSDPATRGVNGSKVELLTDKARGFHLSAPNTYAPTLVNGIGGRQGLRFDSGNYLVTNLTMTAQAQYRSVLAVMRRFAPSGAYQTFMGSNVSGGNYLITFYNSGIPYVYVVGNSDVMRATNTTPQDQDMLFHVSLGQRKFFVNGSEQALSVNSPSYQPYGDANLVLGVNQGQEPFLGIMGEIVCLYSYDNTINPKVEGYLAWKWGLQGNLPANHPYKSAPPMR